MISSTHIRSLVVAFVLTGAPCAALADRGAFTLDAGFFSGFESASPGVGSGSAVSRASWGGLLGARYAVFNDLELTGTALYQAPVDYSHPNTTVTLATKTGAYTGTGTLQTRVSSWGITAGARWVHGVVWRYFAGGEFGFANRSFSDLDFMGFPLADSSTATALLVPVAGIEWDPTDHFSLGLSVRAQMYLGEPSGVQMLVPLTLSYAWY